MGRLLFVTGGARSGKSRFALERARNAGTQVVYIATGVATDDEMANRIARHRAERPPGWNTLEVRYGIADAISQTASSEEQCLLLEDLGTLVSNLLVEQSAGEEQIASEVHALLSLVETRCAELIVVSNEVGLGLVPTSRMGRVFRDLLGLANQSVAVAADEAVMLVSGLPLWVKRAPKPLSRARDRMGEGPALS